jgi:NAD(P)-dependent dehydrogenase (short-subunit alcohol dehydrogenase family)
MTAMEGRRVLVTGASGSLGSATVAALRGQGATVVGLDLIAADGVIACDLRGGDAVAAAVALARDRMGGIEAAVHYAGIGVPTSAGAAPAETALSTLDINLLGPWRVTAACIDDIVAARGRIVFVASELAYATIPFATAYTVSKRGLTAYADSLRTEYGSHVGVTTVYPGYVRTPIHDASVAAGLSLEATTRPQRVDDIVGTVLHALSARRAPRDVACTARGRVELATARHIPGVVDAVIRARLRRMVARGRYIDAPLAAAMRARLGFPDPRPVSAAEEVSP